MKRKDSKLTTLVVIACIMLVVFGISIGRTITSDNKNYKAGLDEPLLGDTTAVSLKVGGKKQLTADTTYCTPTDYDAELCSFGWTSSNLNIVHVNANGLITGKSAGTATIEAKAIMKNGNIYAAGTWNVTVTNDEIPAVITCSNFTYSGNSTVVATCSNCRSMTAYNSSGTVSGTGSTSVSVNSAGKYTISGAGKDGYSNPVSKTCTISNIEKPVITNCTTTVVGNVKVGDSVYLTSNPSDVEWWNSTSSAAVHDQYGRFIATKTGEAVVYASKNGVDSDACRFTVSASETLVTAINIQKNGANITNDNINIGVDTTYTAVITPNNATYKTVKWTSSDTTVATVTSNGKVTGLKAGNATITVTAQDGSNVSNSIRVTVTGISVTAVEITNCPNTMNIGEQLLLTATVKPNNASIKTVNWRNSSTSKATVEKHGLVTASNTTGQATIYAEAKDSSGKQAICTFSVVNPNEPILTNIHVNGREGDIYWLALPVSSSSPDGSVMTAGLTALSQINNQGIESGVVWNVTRTSGTTATGKIEGNSVVFTAIGQASANQQPVKNVFTVSGTYNGVTKTQEVTVWVYCPWTHSGHNDNGLSVEVSSSWTSRLGKRFAAGCVAYEGSVTKNDGKRYYTDRYDRCCGSSSPSTPTETKYACYANATLIENATEAAWLSEKQGNLIYEIPQVTSEDECLPYACYGNAANIVDATRVLWTNVQPFGYTKYTGVARGNCVETKKTPACYGNGVTLETSNDFIWSDVTPTGYTKFEGVAEENCKKPAEETPACYRDLNGEYHWGKYYTTVGYEQMPIYDEANCKKPTEDQACYRNASGSYYWGVASEGAVKVIEVDDIDNCGEPEEEMCYLVGSEYRWGALSRITGAVPVTSIKSAALCVNDAACYKSPDGNYYWGPYANNEGFVKVDNITSPDKCTNDDVYVPQTAASVQTIVYVFMTILVVAGLVFVYYAFTQNKKSKN